MLSLGQGIAKAAKLPLQFVKDNLKLYLDFKSSKSDTLKFPSEGSTDFELDSTHYIKIPHSTDLSLGTDPHTIACWAKFENLGNYRTLISKRGTGTDYNLAVGLNGEIYTYNGSAVAQSANSVISAGIWHHIVLVYDGSAYVLYVDGVVKSWSSGTTTSGSANTDPLYIGYSSNASEYMDGKMANVAIWKRDLSQEEVQSIMNKSYSQLKGVEKTSLVSWWALDSAVLGSELIADGDFSSSDNWTESSGWTIDTTQGKAIYVPDGTNNYRTMPYTDATLNTLAEYEVTITIDSCSNFANCGIVVGGTVRNFSPNHVTSTGTTTFSVVIGRADLQLWSQNASITISNISVKEKNVHTDSKGSNNGVNVGATTTTSVYGGNAPILPRAVDVAKEGQADAIGDGSANFTIGNTDYIEIKNTGIVLQNWSISFWVRIGANLSGSYPGIVTTRSGNNNDYQDGVTLQYFNDYFDAEGASQSGHLPKVAGNTNLDDGEWHHVVYTSDRNGKNQQYINGIFITDENAINNPTNADTIQIGARFFNNTVRDYWDGDIAQVGFWQGILDQPKVQKLYESTSYSKIPADVKSTLGNELVANATDWTDSNSDGLADNWTDNYSGKLDYSIVTGNGFTGNAQRFEVNDVAGNDRAIRTSATVFTSGKLYKVSFKYRASISSGSILVMDGGSGTTVTNITTHTGDAKLFETYYVAPTGSHLWFYMQNADANAFMEIDEVSIKEVTNDLVAYYPLDESKHQAPFGVPVFGAVEDVTTGENLGSELFTGFTNTDCATFNYNSSTKELTATCDGSNQEVHASINLENGKIYRVEFTTGANYSSTVFLRGFKNDTSLEGNASSPDFNRGYFGTNNTYVFYTRATATGTKYIGFRGSSGNTIHITNFSVKKADSNMGLLL